MRFLSALAGDIRYQIKYGFYLLYAFFSAVYIAALFLCPAGYRKTVGALIVLADPALLGSFFIGAIWLLEKGEGLHGFYGTSPLRPMEYILSKGLSLAVISTVSTDLIVCVGIREVTNYLTLSLGALIGSVLFTVVGLVIASYARSVNHYMLLASPLEVLVAIPPVLAAFGIEFPAFDLLPGMALWRIIGFSVGSGSQAGVWPYLILVLWLAVALLAADRRIPKAMGMEGGGKA